MGLHGCVIQLEVVMLDAKMSVTELPCRGMMSAYRLFYVIFLSLQDKMAFISNKLTIKAGIALKSRDTQA
jgi:hypothetical protein